MMETPGGRQVPRRWIPAAEETGGIQRVEMWIPADSTLDHKPPVDSR